MMLLPTGVPVSAVTRLSVEVADSPGVLLRVLGVCQRRGARVVALTYGAAGERARLELAVTADERALRLVRARLDALVDVHAVT